MVAGMLLEITNGYQHLRIAMLFSNVCHQDMLKDALELFEGMLVSYPQMKLEVCHIFLENLCIAGFISIAHVMVEELLSQGWILNRVAYSHLVRGLCAENFFRCH